MPTPFENVLQVVENNPRLAPFLIGSGLGAATGALSSEEGAEGRGALGGALIGGAGGFASSVINNKIREIGEILRANKGQALTWGAASGGLSGGYMARQHLAPWVRKRLESQEVASDSAPQNDTLKEAAMSEPTKEDMEKKAQMEKVALERIAAFDLGMETFFNEVGINKEALAKHLGLENQADLAPAVIQWLAQEQK